MSCVKHQSPSCVLKSNSSLCTERVSAALKAWRFFTSLREKSAVKQHQHKTLYLGWPVFWWMTLWLWPLFWQPAPHPLPRSVAAERSIAWSLRWCARLSSVPVLCSRHKDQEVSYLSTSKCFCDWACIQASKYICQHSNGNNCNQRQYILYALMGSNLQVHLILPSNGLLHSQLFLTLPLEAAILLPQFEIWARHIPIYITHQKLTWISGSLTWTFGLLHEEGSDTSRSTTVSLGNQKNFILHQIGALKLMTTSKVQCCKHLATKPITTNSNGWVFLTQKASCHELNTHAAKFYFRANLNLNFQQILIK